MIQDAFSVLQERGFVQQCNDLAGLRTRLSERPMNYYVGFDPTRDSLHCGSLMPIMAMAHMQRAGHVGRRQLDGEIGAIGVECGLGNAAPLPFWAPFRLDGGGFEALG